MNDFMKWVYANSVCIITLMAVVPVLCVVVDIIVAVIKRKK